MKPAPSHRGRGVLALGIVSRNTASAFTPPGPQPEASPHPAPPPWPGPVDPVRPLPRHAGRGIVLVGMPGAGKTSIGRRLAMRLGLPFLDADTEIEAAAGLPITDIFARYGEAHFRDGERRVIARLLAGPPIVLATGGGAFADARTRAAIRASGAVSVWLHCRMATLLKRVAGREHRPMFLNADPAEVLERLMAARHPLYAEADIVIACSDESPETTTRRVLEALDDWTPAGPAAGDAGRAQLRHPDRRGPAGPGRGAAGAASCRPGASWS